MGDLWLEPVGPSGVVDDPAVDSVGAVMVDEVMLGATVLLMSTAPMGMMLAETLAFDPVLTYSTSTITSRTTIGF